MFLCILLMSAHIMNTEDPKIFDGSDQETSAYEERSLQIGKEMLFVFSKVAEGL